MTRGAQAPAVEGAPGDRGAAGSDHPRRGWARLGGRGNVLVTALAFVVALAIGAVFIAVADPATQAASKYFFAYPWDTFTAAGKAVVNAYVALFEGAIFNPNTAS